MDYTNIRMQAEVNGTVYTIETDQTRGQRVVRTIDKLAPSNTGNHLIYKRDYHKQVVLADGEQDGQLYIIEDQTTHIEVTKANMVKTSQIAFVGDANYQELAELFSSLNATTTPDQENITMKQSKKASKKSKAVEEVVIMPMGLNPSEGLPGYQDTEALAKTLTEAVAVLQAPAVDTSLTDLALQAHTVEAGYLNLTEGEIPAEVEAGLTELLEAYNAQEEKADGSVAIDLTPIAVEPTLEDLAEKAIQVLQRKESLEALDNLTYTTAPVTCDFKATKTLNPDLGLVAGLPVREVVSPANKVIDQRGNYKSSGFMALNHEVWATFQADQRNVPTLTTQPSIVPEQDAGSPKELSKVAQHILETLASGGVEALEQALKDGSIVRAATVPATKPARVSVPRATSVPKTPKVFSPKRPAAHKPGPGMPSPTSRHYVLWTSLTLAQKERMAQLYQTMSHVAVDNEMGFHDTDGRMSYLLTWEGEYALRAKEALEAAKAS